MVKEVCQKANRNQAKADQAWTQAQEAQTWAKAGVKPRFRLRL